MECVIFKNFSCGAKTTLCYDFESPEVHFSDDYGVIVLRTLTHGASCRLMMPIFKYEIYKRNRKLYYAGASTHRIFHCFRGIKKPKLQAHEKLTHGFNNTIILPTY